MLSIMFILHVRKNEIISNDLNGLSHNAITNNDLSWIFAWGGRFGWV